MQKFPNLLDQVILQRIELFYKRRLNCLCYSLDLYKHLKCNMKNNLSPQELHSAGAVIKHDSPFNNLNTLKNNACLEQSFIDNWVLPFYQESLYELSENFLLKFEEINKEVNHQVIEKLLGEFNWRPRSVGGVFAAIKNYVEFKDNIGKLLLKSELSYAGTSYCLALAAFESDDTNSYLKRYLEHYLDKKELYFEQGVAMAALNWIDQKHNSNELDIYLIRWKKFTEDKPSWNLEQFITNFNKQMDSIMFLREKFK